MYFDLLTICVKVSKFYQSWKQMLFWNLWHNIFLYLKYWASLQKISLIWNFEIQKKIKFEILNFIPKMMENIICPWRQNRKKNIFIFFCKYYNDPIWQRKSIMFHCGRKPSKENEPKQKLLSFNQFNFQLHNKSLSIELGVSWVQNSFIVFALQFKGLKVFNLFRR